MSEPRIKRALSHARTYLQHNKKLVILNVWDVYKHDKPAGKMPLHKNWPERDYEPEDIYRAIKKGHNVGMRLEADDLVIDVDPRHFAEGRDGLAELTAFLGFNPADHFPTVLTGAGGYHFYAKKPVDLKTQERREDLFTGVEFKCLGRQVVIPPSVHPGDDEGNYRGELYEADDFCPSVSEVPEAPDELLTAIERVARESSGEAGVMDCVGLASLLDQLDVTDYREHEDWFSLMAASHHATDGEGVEEFVSWSMQDAQYAGDEEAIRYRWDTLSDKEASITYLTLYKAVRDAGGSVSQVDAKKDFDEVGDDELEAMSAPQLDEDDAQKQLDKITRKGAALALAKALDGESSDEEIEDALRAVSVCRSEVEKVKALDIIRKATKIAKGDLNQILKGVSEQQLNDLGEMVAEITLKKHFDGGDGLIRASDRRFWQYTGRYWKIYSEDLLLKRTIEVVSEVREKMSITVNTTSLATQARLLLTGLQACDGDHLRMNVEPEPVINCQNCEIWINPDGAFTKRKHRFDSYLTYCLDVDYDPKADCPEFKSALLDIFRDSTEPEEMARHIVEFMGYAIQPQRDIASWWLWQGYGSNGKTLISEILTALASPASVLSTSIEDLDTRRDKHALAQLPGKLIALDDDVDARTVLPDGILKKISERKLLTANPKGKDTFDFISCAVPLLLANRYPSTRDISRGTRRRANVIPFHRTFSEGETDRGLAKRIIKNELPGVLNLCLEGFKRLRERGYFDKPQDCIDAEKTWFNSANSTNAFISHCCVDDVKERLELKEVYDRYRVYCMDEGVTKPLGKRNFKENLQSLGYTCVNGSGNRVYVSGVKFRPGLAGDDFGDL